MIRQTMTSYQKQKIITSIREKLLTCEEIVFAYLHGSFLDKGDFADVDIALFLDSAKVPKEDAISYELEKAVQLSRQVGLEIDVRVLNYAPLGFQFNVTKGRLLLTKDERLHQEFVECVWLEYMDFAAFLDALKVYHRSKNAI
ncbi:nucleotidyltransferase domain-containing protein [bacterium]|nr:nucleotidyltransferase domain-containing protein [bacterium]